MITLDSIYNHIKGQFQKVFKEKFKKEPEEVVISRPPEVSWGDFTIACFPFSKEFKRNPSQIAEEIAERVSQDEIIYEAVAMGPYVNFRLRKEKYFNVVIDKVLSERVGFGASSSNKDKVMVEYLSPNTTKPLHLGHARNGILGMALSNILEFQGSKVIKANLVNDRGAPICGCMVAYQNWRENKNPSEAGMKGDHFVGNLYVKYVKEKQDPSAQNQVQECLKKWEENDPETISLWKKITEWVYEGFEETYKEMEFSFDATYYESEIYKLGKDIVQKGLEEGILDKQEDGSIAARLPKEEFGGEKDSILTLLRADGTSLYITGDLGAAQRKFNDYDLDKSIYVVGNEQTYYFKCLFYVLRKLGYEKWVDKSLHLPYGNVSLPEGKMKSREGNVVEIDALLEEMKCLARREVEKRSDNSSNPEELEARADKIAKGAIKFYLLQYSPKRDIRFNPAQSISFEGVTGPYCQYGYARAQSILSQSEAEKYKEKKADFSLLGNEEELWLLRAVEQFPETVARARKNLDPSTVCGEVYKIAKSFNQFYQKHRVIDSGEPELTASRLKLVQAAQITLKQGLNLLGIDVLEEM